MKINFYNEEIEMPVLDEKKLTEWIQKVTKGFNKKIGEITYIFCNDEKILEVNRQYLQHDYYTDIITFDYTEGNRIGGDLFISLDTVKSNAEEFKQDYDTELHRVIIHGVLHLCGVNDQSPEERQHMIDEENKALALIKR